LKEAKIKLVSNRKGCYQHVIPMLWGTGIGYIMVGTAFFGSYLVLQHNSYLALSLFIPALAFAILLGVVAYRLIADILCDYTLEISAEDVVFSKYDRLRKKQTNQLALLSDIKYVEYYPYQDSASIIFHTNDLDIDVPLWPLGGHVQDVVDFLTGAGVRVIDVQSDESIPI